MEQGSPPHPRQPFPAAMPASLDDDASIVENDWVAYSSLSSLTNHWTRPAWPDLAAACYWLIPLDQADSVAVEAEQCRGALRSDGLDPVTRERLHLTVLRVGDWGSTSATVIKRIAGAAAQAFEPLRAFTISVGPLAGSAGAVRFSVTPWRQLYQVHRCAAIATGIVEDRVPADFRPHVSIAYNSRNRPAASVIAEVAGLRGRLPVLVTVTGVSLVRLQRVGFEYRWETLHHVALSATR